MIKKILLIIVIFIYMNYKKVVKQIISEIIHDQMKPTMKYYAFDWDDNLMYMPTKIYLKDDKGNSVGMSTEDFAEYRTEIGKEPFEYEGHKIVGFADDPFRYFSVKGDKQFIIDSLLKLCFTSAVFLNLLLLSLQANTIHNMITKAVTFMFSFLDFEYAVKVLDANNA